MAKKNVMLNVVLLNGVDGSVGVTTGGTSGGCEDMFKKIGYTKEELSLFLPGIEYSYELLEIWDPSNPDLEMFQQSDIAFFPLIDTSNVTNMKAFFYNCPGLIMIPLLDTQNVVNMQNMFGSCPSLHFVPLLNTCNVTNMSSMFSSCKCIETIPAFNTSKVTDMSSMFSSCSRLKAIPNFDTSQVTNMNSMFSYCSVLKSLPDMDTKKVEKMTFMFNQNYFLEKINGLDLDSLTVYPTNGLFADCPKTTFIILRGIGKSTLATHDFSGATVWGTGGEENRQSLIDSLITYSYDRASNGMPTATIKLSANTKALLTDKEIEQITAKGFTIS